MMKIMRRKILFMLFSLHMILAVLLGACTPQAATTTAPTAGPTLGPTTAPTIAVPSTSQAGEATTAPTDAPQAEPTGSASQELVTRILTDILSQDPFDIQTVTDQYIASNVHCQLVKFTPGGSGEILPDLATDWSVSDDGLVWTFNLVDNAQFHKGYGPVTADGVKYSLDRILFGEEPSPNAVYINKIEEVVVIDSTTVELRMSEPQASLLTGLAYRPGFIVPQAAVEELGDNFKTNPVGCGPYVFESWTPGIDVVLTRNEEYFGDLPTINRAVFRVIPDEAVAALAFEAGELDVFITRSGDVLAGLRDNPNYQVDLTPSPSYRVLVMNMSKPPFDNKLVREAIAHAINKDEIIELLGGTLSPIDSPLDAYRFSGTDYKRYEYDPERSRALLTEAGYPDGLDLDLQFTQLSPWPDIVPIISQQLAAVGVRLNATVMEHGAWTSFWQTGDYTINVQPLGRPPDPDLPLQIAFHSERTPPGANMAYYSGIDDLIEAGSVATSDAERAEIYAEIQRQIAEDVPVVPIAAQNVVAVMWNYVEGYQAGLNNEFWLYTMSLNK
jgi:peptide/nickel transport system substrate-binding protein